MKILMAVSNFYPALDLGGLVQTPWELSQILTQMGHQVDVVTSNLLGSNRKLSSRTLIRREQEVNITYLNAILRHRASGITPGVFKYCRQIPDYDVVHLFGLRDMVTTAVALAAQQYRIPYIVEPMGMYKRILRSFLKKALYDGLLGRRVLEGSSKIVATSEFEKTQLSLSAALIDKIVLRINGIDIDFFEQPVKKGSFRAQLGISDQPLLLFLGRVIAKKNVDWLIEMLSNLHTTHLAIVGDYTEEPAYYESLKRKIAKHDLAKRVHFVGPLYDKDKLPAFADSDLFCLPSQSENYANAVAEAIASDTPVAITDRCGIAPLVGEAGIVTPYSYQTYGKAVQELLQDEGRLQRLRNNCSKVKQTLSWSQPSEKMINIYSAL